MDIVLGVSMTPGAVRMVLVEGDAADGRTIDRDCLVVDDTGSIERVVAAILGTRGGAAEGGHHLRSIGVAWTDHAAAARLRQALRQRGIDDVLLVSELHAASALAQAVGQTVGSERICLLFLEPDVATLAVVRTHDGAVVRVDRRSVQSGLAGEARAAQLREMVAGLRTAAEPPQAVFMVGSGVDIAALTPQLETWAGLPVHAPDEGELALARGAALASATAPRFEASTVGLAPGPTTAMVGFDSTRTSVGATQRAAAGYMAPLGYSAVTDEDDDLPEFTAGSGDGPWAGGPDETEDLGRKPFLLIGSALSTVFVVGVVALAISLAVVVRPAVDQRPDPTSNPIAPTGQAPVADERAPGARGAPQTIQAPVPVVQQLPRTVTVAPAAPAPEPMRPPQPILPAPAPAPAAPTPAASVPAAPAPASPPILIPVPIPVAGSPLLPSIGRLPVLPNPATAASDFTDATDLEAPPTNSKPTNSQPTTQITPQTAAPETTPQTSAPQTTTESAAPSSATSSPSAESSAASSAAPTQSAQSTQSSVKSTQSASSAAKESPAGRYEASEDPLWPLSPPD